MVTIVPRYCLYGFLADGVWSLFLENSSSSSFVLVYCMRYFQVIPVVREFSRNKWCFFTMRRNAVMALRTFQWSSFIRWLSFTSKIVDILVWKSSLLRFTAGLCRPFSCKAAFLFGVAFAMIWSITSANLPASVGSMPFAREAAFLLADGVE